MKLKSEGKCHYKMYKKGRTWVFAGVLVCSWAISDQLAQGATEPTPTETPTQTTVAATSASNQTATLKTSGTAQAATPASTTSNATSPETSATDNSTAPSANDDNKVPATDAETPNEDTPASEAKSADNATVPSQSPAPQTNSAGDTPQPTTSVATDSKPSQAAAPTQPVTTQVEQVAPAKVVIPVRTNSRLSMLKMKAISESTTDNLTTVQAAPTDVTGLTEIPTTAIASGQCGTSTWYIDQGVLHIGTGTLAKPKWDWPWLTNKTDISKVIFDGVVVAPTSTAGMFDYVQATFENLNNLDTKNVTDMTEMFQGGAIGDIDISSWDITNVGNMHGMFLASHQLTSIILPTGTPKKLYDVSYLLDECDHLTSVKLNGIDLSKVKSKDSLFAYCSSLTSSTSFDVDVFRIGGGSHDMFKGCTGLTSLNIELLDDGSYTEANGLFKDCTNLETINFLNETRVRLKTT
ncbi:BspA family leucine-rich repeat surface protein [Lactiplantibacillus daowaiensis]|uniref:BspA family leucine-rich repeat surface protein n=1 Tax=Lactiplantibacillus daowaiensis TaxID=2559918 RepID=A0ABW1S0G9_9LACO|nr:BspA family leucine-rich repeat surface protein [Lactiplantibacillus daowaiensis]